MDNTIILGSGPETMMPTYKVWLAQQNQNPANLKDRKRSYRDYIQTFSKLIVAASQVSGFDYIVDLFQNNVNNLDLQTDQDCDKYEQILDDLVYDVNAALQALQAPQHGGTITQHVQPAESLFLFIPIEATGLTISEGGQKVVTTTFEEEDLGLKCLDHYSALHIVVNGKLTIASANAVKKEKQNPVMVYLNNVAPSGGSIAKNQAGPGGRRLDLQPPFTLQNTAGGEVYQKICNFMRILLSNKQMESGLAKSVQHFCNTCLAFSGPIQLANWQVQGGAQGAGQFSYSAVLMGGSTGVPLPIYIQAHSMSARRKRRCYVCIVPSEIVAALRTAGLLEDVLRLAGDAAWK